MEKMTYLDRLAKYQVNGAHPGGLALTSEILRNENIKPDTTLLDVGCGTGQTAVYIAKRHSCKITAVDINPEMLKKARQKLLDYSLDIPLIQADAMDLPFPRCSFDIVLAESVTIFTNIRKTLPEYCRVLKSGGILLEIEATALVPLSWNEFNDFQTVLGIEQLPTKEQWRQMFRDAGFSETRVLSIRRMNWIQALFPRMNRVFNEYADILFRYRNKFGYGVYRVLK